MAETAAFTVPALERRGRDQGDQREGDQQDGDRKVKKGDEREDGDGREQGDEDLRQVLAEVGLQLFDPIDHGEHDVAGALQTEMGGAEFDHFVVQALAQVALHPCRGAMGHHVPPVLETPAQRHDAGDRGERHDHDVQGLAPEYLGKQPAEQSKPGDAERRRQKTDHHRPGDSTANALGELP